jgi:hypothetical protein
VLEGGHLCWTDSNNVIGGFVLLVLGGGGEGVITYLYSIGDQILRTIAVFNRVLCYLKHYV